MDNTPKNKISRPRHTPTPKMSERKKSLFTSSQTTITYPTTIDEDSDLGPMSPLQFSCSPTSYDSYDTNNKGQFMRYRDTTRTNFTNIITQLSPLNGDSDRCQSLTPKKNLMTPQFDSSEINLVGKENCAKITEKTPGEGTIKSRLSFRKSLIFDTGLTPDESHNLNRKCTQKRSSFVDDSPNSSTDVPKARASLTFTEQAVIPAKTFYGSSFNESTPKRREVRKTSHQLPKKSRRSHGNSSKRAKANKQRAIQRPVLGNINKGVRLKIAKPKVQNKNKIVGLKSMTKTQIIEAAIDLIQNRSKAPAKIKQTESISSGTSKVDKDTQITSDQIERLQKILKNQRNLLDLSSKPLNWTGTKPQTSYDSTDFPFKNTNASKADFEDSNQTQSKNHEVSQEELSKPRKFFKSKTSANANKYTIMKGVCATVKRGAGVSLLSPKRKKQKQCDCMVESFFICIVVSRTNVFYFFR